MPKINKLYTYIFSANSIIMFNLSVDYDMHSFLITACLLSINDLCSVLEIENASDIFLSSRSL